MPEKEVWLVSNGAYWKAVWTAKDGSRASKSIGPKAKYSRRQARVLARELARESAGPATSAPRLFEWLDRYEAMRSDVKDKTRRGYRECGLYLRAYFDNDPHLDQITRGGAADWRDALASGELTRQLNDREKGKPKRRKWKVPTLSTVRKHVRAAKQMLQEAADRDLITVNPFDRLKGAPPKPLKTWREVTQADLARILDACPNQGWRALFALCRLAALRLEEALTLGWVDVNWAGNRIRVNEGIDRETTKQRYRTCPIEPARLPTGLADILRTTLEAAPDGAALVCHGVFRNNLRRTALGILRKSGVGEYAKPFHTLRKCRISELALEYPQGVLMEWVGHDEDVSRRHYQRVPEELYAAPVSKAVSKEGAEVS